MPNRQQARSEETRQAILAAAEQLFSQRGYDAVTMREIARDAGCSHTAIYLYFKDKEALLHQLALGPLGGLRRDLEAILQDGALEPAERLRRMCRTFLHFGLTRRNSYSVLFMARAGRVDVAEPALPVNALRNHLFALLRQAVASFLPDGLSEEQVLAYARVAFFSLHGIIETYRLAEEGTPSLMDRLGQTFDLSIEVLLRGMQTTALRGVQPSEDRAGL
jgi:AcrR family transcriptional regulator